MLCLFPLIHCWRRETYMMKCVCIRRYANNWKRGYGMIGFWYPLWDAKMDSGDKESPWTSQILICPHFLLCTCSLFSLLKSCKTGFNSLSSTIYTFISPSNTLLFLFPYLTPFCFYFPIYHHFRKMIILILNALKK